MLSALVNLARLARAGLVFAEHGVRFVPKGTPVPVALRLARLAALAIGVLTWPLRSTRAGANQTRIAAALADLGPSYIKAGQFFATRGDLVGRELAADLAGLQDRMPPFPEAEARRSIERALQQPVESLFAELGPPVAAASIAQVHKGVIEDEKGRREVAVKVLRPGVGRRFDSDLESFAFAARLIEWIDPRSRRLRPVAVVDTLKRSVELELDLRLEAAAISELGANTAKDEGFRVPQVEWTRTAKEVLTAEWIEGIHIDDVEALSAAGHDLTRLGTDVIRHFLRHAMRDGFFHADMHPGNLFVDPQGRIVAVDFGIMGRLSPRERRFLAEILYGFIARDYRRAAQAHFAAGYVPEHHSVEVFAQALRAIGEPLMGRPAEEISMGHLLGQLLEYTDVFDMQTRPELILLQKTMVVVEGVARMLDPRLNIWTAAEPVVEEWMRRELGLEGRLEEARMGAGKLGKALGDLPPFLLEVERVAGSFVRMAERGIRLDAETVERLAEAQSGRRGWLWLYVLLLLMAGWWAVLYFWPPF